MSAFQLTITVFTAGCLFWLGLYLIGRNARLFMIWLAGAGLFSFSILLTLTMLELYAPSIAVVHSIRRWQIVFSLLPLLFWLGFLWRVAPRQSIWRQRMQESRVMMLVIMGGTVLFGLGIGFMQLADTAVTRFWVLHLLAVNLLVLGTAVAALDAADEGESLWPHYLRSLDYAFFTALLFGIQVVLAMRYATGVNFAMLILLIVTIDTAIIVQTFSSRLTSWLDGIAFFNFPAVRAERAALRAGSDAAARINESVDVMGMEPEAFARLTRKAISNMGNLPHLAASPLTQLPLVTVQLQVQGASPDTLGRAAALKQLLADSIHRLKPEDEQAFGTTDAWRHYNALYFPYVRGIRPYRRRIDWDQLDSTAQEALQWFRQEVPTRTLYNWQTAAARLVAQDLRERSRREVVSGE